MTARHGLRGDFALLFLVLFVVAAGNTALQSVLPTIGRQLGMPDLLVATIFSFSALIWTFAAPYWAEASDRRGRKALIQLGLGGYFVSKLMCAFVILAGLLGYIGPVVVFVIFAVARSLFGLFGSASNPAAQAYVGAHTSREQRTRALSVLASAFGLGTIVGPAVAPFFVMPVVTLSGPLFAFAGIALLTLIVVSRRLPKDAPVAADDSRPVASFEPTVATGPRSSYAARTRVHKRLSWRDPRILPFSVFGLVIGNAQAASGQSLGFFIIDRLGMEPVAAQSYIGVALMAAAAATLLAQWALIPMFHLGPKLLMRWGAALAAAGSLLLAFAEDFHAIVLAFALASLGYGFARPGFSAGASLAVGIEDQGAAAGAITAVNGASFVIAPTVGIALYQFAQPLPYLVSAAMLLAMLVYAFRNRLLSTDLDRD
jgi:MFS family permease